MDSNKKWLVIAFVIVAVIAMYVYGTILSNKAREQQERKEDSTLYKDLAAQYRNNDSVKGTTLQEQSRALSNKDSAIASLNDSLWKLKQKSDSIVSNINNQVDDSTKPEEESNAEANTEKEASTSSEIEKTPEYHPYGKGKGRLAFYKKCLCNQVSVWVDDDYVGLIVDTYFQPPSSFKMLKIDVSRGWHHMIARDLDGDSWDTNIFVEEDSCRVETFKGLKQN